MSHLLARLDLAFKAAFELRCQHLLNCKSDNEVIRLSVNMESLEKADVAAITRWFDIAHPFCDVMECMIPTRCQLHIKLRERDDEAHGKISKMKMMSSRDAWAAYEASKFHDLLSLANRYSCRKSNPRSGHLRVLKALWRTHRPALIEKDNMLDGSLRNYNRVLLHNTIHQAEPCLGFYKFGELKIKKSLKSYKS